MVNYLNELGKNCSLHVVFEKGIDENRPDSWANINLEAQNFSYTILHGMNIVRKTKRSGTVYSATDQSISFQVIKHLRQEYDYIIVANPCTPTGIIAIMYMKIKSIQYAIQSEGGFPGSGKGIKERFKRFLMKDACHFFSTCRLDDDYFFMYGATLDRIRRYPFASMYKNELPSVYPGDEERKSKKKELGIPYKKIILSVGRVIPVKGFDIIIHAFSGIQESDIGLYIIGGLATQNLQSLINELKVSNIHFVDNLCFQELLKYYNAADLFVLATRGDTWGLVINEAMAFGLPVVTTDMCVAANALVDNGINGFIVPVDDIEKFQCKIQYLLSNDNIRCDYGRNSFSRVKDYTFENMGKVVYSHIESFFKRERQN